MNKKMQPARKPKPADFRTVGSRIGPVERLSQTGGMLIKG